jgi:hypothetical protein
LKARFLVVLISMLAAGSCATPSSYKDVILPITVQDQADGTILILASGNGWTPLEAVTDFTYLKAAETVQARGHECFAVIGQDAKMSKTVIATQYGGNVHYFPDARLRIKILPGVTGCETNNVGRLIAELTPRVADKKRYSALRQEWDRTQTF